MAIEDPIDLLHRLKLGREEYCQRLLTMLIVGGGYPRWNTRNSPSKQGAAFLADLYLLAFGRHCPSPADVFVDEFELLPRSDAEKGGAPDWAVVWSDRLWMIELKTESASHRPDQLSHYLDLARHHHPGAAIDLTYLTPKMNTPALPVGPHERFGHVAWDDVAGLIRATWQGGTREEQAVSAALLDVLGELKPTWPEWRTARLAGRTSADAPQGDPVVAALALAEQTAADGQQRALDYRASGLDELDELRLQVREAIRASPDDHPVRRVRPWVWRATTSGGIALTRAAAETGYELRVSRYGSPIT